MTHRARFLQVKPTIHPTAFVAPSADIMGDVTIGENASVWYQTVLRADINRIVVGANSNVQDGTVIHLEQNQGTIIGEHVTVGHKALLHACTIEDEVLVGMGSIIMDGCVVGSRSIIGAGALLTMNTIVPPGSMVFGSPAKVVRSLSEEEQKGIRRWSQNYVDLVSTFRAHEGQDTE
jgi:carbonic anhydrase/acetyltransferase-like protein (isoleucine patch superfamily)